MPDGNKSDPLPGMFGSSPFSRRAHATQDAPQKSSRQSSKFIKAVNKLNMPSAVNNLYEFGEFRLDPLKRVWLRGNLPVSLTPKAFDILACNGAERWASHVKRRADEDGLA